MKRLMNYIGILLLIGSVFGCTDERLFSGSDGELRVTGSVETTTRTSYTIGDESVAVSWAAGDKIGLFSEGQPDVMDYRAAAEGKQADFIPEGTRLKNEEGTEVYAYYPYEESGVSYPYAPFKYIFSQSYTDGHPDPNFDFMYAKGEIRNGELTLHFKHLFSFLKLNIRTELLKDAQGLLIRSDETIIPVTDGNRAPYFNIEKEIIEGVKYDHFWYSIPSEVIQSKEVVTCYLTVCPTSENNRITFYIHDKDGKTEQAILQRKAPKGGFQAGHVYDLTVDEFEFDDVTVTQQKEREALVALYEATDGDNWKNNTNWCSDKPLNEWYGVGYWDGGVREVNLSDNGLTGNLPVSIINLNQLSFFDLTGNRLSGTVSEEILASSWWSEIGRDGILFQQEGYKLNFPLYESSDYSMDGTVVTLQEHTIGTGLKLVIFGEAYSDRLIANGTYQSDARIAMEAFFAEEPYNSFREYFDVYVVNLVSRNEVLGENTAFQTSAEFERKTFITNPGKAIDYVCSMIETDYQSVDVTSIVLMRTKTPFRSSCTMFSDGFSVAFCLYKGDDLSLSQLIHHEVCGHGFAKLADEYTEFEGTYPYPESIPPAHAVNESMNVDVTDDPQKVVWSYFLTDMRYEKEKIGIYEGAIYYPKGAYRATENSIMRYNTGGFNAPSRQSIYRRIMEKSGGVYSFEDFLEYDEINRQRMASPSFSRVGTVKKGRVGLPPIRCDYPSSEAKYHSNQQRVNVPLR